MESNDASIQKSGHGLSRGSRLDGLTPERWQRIQEIVDCAINLPDADRTRFVHEHCADDADLQRYVLAMLEADRMLDGFLDKPVRSDVAIVDGGDAVEIDRYDIEQRIGAGGMGIVYRAVRRDNELRQAVAIKVLKRGMNSEVFVRRFQLERQTLANLVHPNIARLYDGGMTRDGRPFIVMELIEGLPIDRYCSEHGLDVAARVDLMSRICGAVAFAHRNLVVHRDIKPANILVDGSGNPKLLDFGVAKVLSPDSQADFCVLTEAGERPMTPRYASPEQIRGEAVTTATDVYALGVVLYELLTGRSPYGSPSSSSALSSAICDTEPVRPSTALYGLASTHPGNSGAFRDDSKTYPRAQWKPADVRRWRREVRGDLDLVILKSMRKDAARRYPSAESLLEDLERWRAGELVDARPESLRYRIDRFARRHRIASAAAVFAALILVSGVVVSWSLLGRERLARQEARLRADEAAWSSYTAQIAAAVEMVRSHDPIGAQRQLLAVPVGQRGWEWRHITSRVDQGGERVATATARVDVLEMTSDCRRIAFGGQDKRITVVDLSDGSVVGHRDTGQEVRSLSFRDNGRTLLWANETDTVHAWDLESDVHHPWLRRTGESILRFTLVPGSEYVALGLRSGDVVVIDHASGEEVARLSGLPYRNFGLTASPDGRWLAAAWFGGGWDVQVWNTRDWTKHHRLSGMLGRVLAIHFDPDSERIAIGSEDCFVRVFDLASGERIGFPIAMPGRPAGVDFSPDGNELVAVGRGLVRRVRLSDGVIVGTAHLADSSTGSTRYTPDGTHLLVGSGAGVRRMDRFAAEVPQLIAQTRVLDATFSPDGSTIVCDGTTAWDAASRSRIAVIREGETRTLRFDASGDRLLCVTPNAIEVRRSDDWTLIASVSSGEHFVSADIAPDDALIAVVGGDGQPIELRDATTLELLRTISASESQATHCVRFSPNGRYLALATAGVGVRVFDVPSGRVVAHLSPVEGLDFCLDWSADGTILAAGGSGGVMVAWDTYAWRERARWSSRAGAIAALAFHPDHSRLAVADGPVVRLLDTARWAEVASLQGHDAAVRALDWSPDGDTLLSAGEDGRVRLWLSREVPLELLDPVTNGQVNDAD